MHRTIPIVAALLLASPFAASAQSWPSQPIRVIVPYPAGGFYDTIARVIGVKMTEDFGQPAVIENRAGANTAD